MEFKDRMVLIAIFVVIVILNVIGLITGEQAVQFVQLFILVVGAVYGGVRQKQQKAIAPKATEKDYVKLDERVKSKTKNDYSTNTIV